MKCTFENNFWQYLWIFFVILSHSAPLHSTLSPRYFGYLQVETIQLYKAENTSLGFSVVGLRSEHRGELGIFVQDIQASGVAAQ